MMMTKTEIARSYRLSKNKKDQIKILSELNNCGQSEIEDILVDAGLVNAKTQSPTRSTTKKPKPRAMSAKIPAAKNEPPEDPEPSSLPDVSSDKLKDLQTEDVLKYVENLLDKRCELLEEIAQIDSQLDNIAKICKGVLLKATSKGKKKV